MVGCRYGGLSVWWGCRYGGAVGRKSSWPVFVASDLAAFAVVVAVAVSVAVAVAVGVWGGRGCGQLGGAPSPAVIRNSPFGGVLRVGRGRDRRSCANW